MPYTTAAKNGMLDGAPLRQRITALSIHTASAPAGGSEVSGGGYARAAVTSADFNAAATGAMTLAADHTFSGPASAAAIEFGAWDGTTFLGNGAITGDAAFNAEGVYVLKAGTSFDLNA
jgi:hypothetical protein